MPNNWGVGPAEDKYLRQAGAVNWLDSNGVRSPATMADIFLGANEPDIIGSCMGDMMGKCIGPCQTAGCPVSHLCGAPGSGQPDAQRHCDCWSDSHATGVGFWPVQGVPGYQPLPTCWSNQVCVGSIMGSWKKTAATVVAKGYKYLSTPLVAVNMNWTKSFMEAACNGCSDISCGCPSHIGWHFYANDCQPEKGGHAKFQEKLDATVAIMEQFPHLQGAIVNEVGMLNCDMATPDAICIPNGATQKYPASKQPNHACPSTPSLPNGLASFVEELLSMVSKAKTTDGRRAVVSFTWFNLNMSGGTYNLRIFSDDGTLNQLGKSYISACQAWANGALGPAPGPPPGPAPPAPPAPRPKPTAPSPTAKCKVGDVVDCPGTQAQKCAGNQCCPDLTTCPSAGESFSGCPHAKTVDCVKSDVVV